MNCFFFYMTSLFNPHISVTLEIKNDSIRYYNGNEYRNERIIHHDGNRYLTPNAYIYIHNEQRVIIGLLGKHEPANYKIKASNHICTQTGIILD